MTGDGRRNTVIETHVSLLVLLDDIVLKYKKPLRLPFADFTSCRQRRLACEAEVECNRRLSPDVYLGVADVRLGDVTLDHAVVLRRLPEERSLRRMAASGHPELGGNLGRLAHVLADFHAGAERSPEIDDDARVDALRATWRKCMDSLGPFAGTVVDGEILARVDELATAYLSGRSALFDERVAHGRVCDGHGDLLASDVFLLEDGPRILDCVEFDARLRHVDVIADVAFLVMDLEHLGASVVASDFVRMYCEAAGDVFPPTLLRYYCAQRAIVRAEVACLRFEQAGSDSQLGEVSTSEARSLLALALDHLRCGRVVLGVIGGLPGTGKSTLAAAAGARLQWPVLRSDEVRRELLGQTGLEPVVGRYEAGGYSPEITELTYATMLQRATTALERGQSVILDATFTDARFQSQAEQVARATASELAVVACEAPVEVAGARMRARAEAGSDVSGADEDVARAMGRAAAPWSRAVRVDTGLRPTSECLDQVLAVLGR